MAIAVLFEAQGMSAAQYDAVVQQLGSAPEPGRLYHVAGPMDGGWRVVDVWESQATLDRFLRERLGPIMAQAGVQPPTQVVWPVHNVIE